LAGRSDNRSRTGFTVEISGTQKANPADKQGQDNGVFIHDDAGWGIALINNEI
jgi:hypothetical protein